jgi:hypothetical protein
MKQDDDRHTNEETEQRLQKTLQGAFSGPPTPLKDIPTRDGETRKSRRASGGSSSATSKTDAPRKKSRA